MHWYLFIILEGFEIPKSGNIAKYVGLQSYFKNRHSKLSDLAWR